MHDKLLLGPVRLRQWGNEYLVYNILTANTHLLDSISGGVFNQMYQKQVSKQELMQYLINDDDALSLQDVTQYIDNIIQRFKEIDLLETGM